MKSRWYFSFIVFILALLGLGQHQISVPNQEIVVQFVNDEVTSDQALKTISIVKNQLECLGVNNIKVLEEEGKLTITYYSDIDASSIKKILSKENNLPLGSSSNKKPQEKDHSNHYNLDVFEIQKQSDSQWGFTGTVVVELKPEGDRFHTPKTYATAKEIDVQEHFVKVAFKIFYRAEHVKNNSSYKIPEVRAGPSV